MLKSKFIRFLACSFFIVGSLCLFIKAADANPPQVMAMPEGSYQLARSTFLPEATDDVWLSHYDKVPNDYNQSPCKKMGYPLKNRCPDHGNCSKCPIDSNYLKLDSCNNDGSQRYQISSDRTYCKKVCNVQTCNTSTYFMSTCPDGMDCDICTEVKSDCTTAVHVKPTTRCISGFHYEGGRCVKDCAEVKCGPGYGTSKEWKDQCAKGYLCTKRPTDYQTTDCKTGSCYQYKGCDEANGYFKPSWSSGGECEYMACYQTATNCDGYSFTSCPANGVCGKSCTVKNKDCSTKETKYNLTGCISGYHLNKAQSACDKDCLKDSVGTPPNTVYYAPIYKTETECENAEGVSQCMSRYVNTDTLCNLAIYYIPARCETGYKMVQTKTTENGYPKTTFKCEKDAPQCEIETCDDYPFSAYPTDVLPGFKVESCQIINEDCSKGITKYKLVAPVCGSEYILNPQTGQCVPGIGSILYNDFTTGVPSEYEKATASGKTPIGVVFDPINTKAIALYYYETVWEYASSYTQTADIPNLPNLSKELAEWNINNNLERNGKENTEIINNYMTSIGKVANGASVSYWAMNEMTSGTFYGEWYIPAIGELYDILSNFRLLENTLTLIGGDVFPTITNDSSHLRNHISSTEYDASRIWYAFVRENDFVPIINYVDYLKNEDGILRLVINYGSRGTPTCTTVGTELKECNGVLGCCPTGSVCDQYFGRRCFRPTYQ